MGFIATDLARVPTGAYDWFIFLLEDDWKDDLRREFSDNFQILAKEVGPRGLVVKGAQPEPFYDQVFYEYALKERGIEKRDLPLPALLITDTAPTEIHENKARSEKAKMILLPLSKRSLQRGGVTELLRSVSSAVCDPDSFEAVKKLDTAKLERHWGWLPRYVEMKPSIFGFGLNVGKMFEDLILKGRRAEA